MLNNRASLFPNYPTQEFIMTADKGVRIIAGTMLLLSLALTHWVHPGFVWLSVFVGLNLIQSAFTGFCPAEKLLRRMGLK